MPETFESCRRIRAIKETVLIVLFIGAVSLPLLGMAFRLDVITEEQENRRLAPFPTLSLEAGALNAFPDRFKNYFNDHLGFRRSLVRWQANIKVNWLGVSSSPLVILGKDGWLFYADEFSPEGRRTVPLFTEKQLEGWRRALEARRDWLAARGIRYLFVIAPHKVTIYPEYLPDALTQLAKETRLRQLIAYLKEYSDLEFLDLRPALSEAKARHILYHKTDSHWNHYGGFTAYQSIIRELAMTFPQIRPVSESDLDVVTQIFSGDLARMLGLNGFMIEERPIVGLRQPSYTIVSVKDYQGNKVTERPVSSSDKLQWTPLQLETVVTTERKDPQLPRAVFFHDSATAFMMPFLPEHFSRMVFKYSPVLDLDLIKSERPDVVVQEMGEMFLMVPPPMDWPEIRSLVAGIRPKDSRGAKLAPPDYTGFHDGADCGQVYGWAWDKKNPNVVLDVEIYDGDRLLATVPADIYRDDLLKAGIGDGEHGFSFQLPPDLKDGRAHSLRVKIAGSNFDLKNTPKSITCPH